MRHSLVHLQKVLSYNITVIRGGVKDNLVRVVSYISRRDTMSLIFRFGKAADYVDD